MRDMRLRVAKLILRGVASSTIAQAEGYPSYTARELSSYFSYSSISISSKPEPELILLLLLLMCVLATNATHKDFNKPTDSRMVAMPMAAS